MQRSGSSPSRLYCSSLFCECPKFCDLAKQRRKIFWGVSEVGKNDFSLYFCWRCVVFLVLYYSSAAIGIRIWQRMQANLVCMAGSKSPSAIHCRTAWGQPAVELLQHTATPPGGSGQWNFCSTLPQCPGAVGSGPPSVHCLTAWGQWAVDLLQCTASLPGGSGQWTSCNTLPHCLGAVSS